jgi:thymidine phosphorylase
MTRSESPSQTMQKAAGAGRRPKRDSADQGAGVMVQRAVVAPVNDRSRAASLKGA